MRYTSGLTSAGKFVGMAAVFVCCLSAFPIPGAAQGTQGQNGVYNSSGGTVVGSSAFIDASMFATQQGYPNICAVLNYVLAKVDQPPTYPNGAVIDARGLNSTNTSMTCTASPWNGIQNTAPPATILLPATGGGTNLAPIVIPSGWVLPPNTRLIGVGDGDVVNSSVASYSGTTIQAKSGFSGTMISMCSSACSGVSIENLSLDGQGQTINVIVNGFATSAAAGASSYVKNVTLFQIVGTGLSVTGSTQGSGPYANITFDTNGLVSSNTVCLNVTASATRGFHGSWIQLASLG